ncbi:MAG: glycosyltransferase family 2 protein [Thiohalocapsa sp.]|nr:glycosyltransferase family 2 protein [Thiohalocapsa sp.]
MSQSSTAARARPAVAAADVRRVAAVVVTYNRLAKLRRCLAAIAAQTDAPERVIVVDNASDDGTGHWLAEAACGDPRLEVLHLPENTGGAGGFHAGIGAAVAEGADDVWVMDDDCYPGPDALALLRGAMRAHEAQLGWVPAFACSRVLSADGVTPCLMNTPAVVPHWTEPYTKTLRAVAVRNCSFVSCLFRAEDVRRVGLPLKEYFIWFDDIEYTRRLAGERYGLAVLDSVAVHDMPRNAGVHWSELSSDSLWKYRFGMRNEAAWRLRNEGFRSYLWYLRMARAEMRRGGVPRRLRFAIYRSALAALRFDPAPEFPVVSENPGANVAASVARSDGSGIERGPG